jgi:hypothetical protein
MKFLVYVDHVQRALCWFCHKPTHKSHATQRQCPQCRRKWSYRRRETELQLINKFVTGYTAAEASRECGVVYRTSWTYFLRFEQAARQSDWTWELQRFVKHRKAGIRRPYPVETALRELVYTRLVKPFVPRPGSTRALSRTRSSLDLWLRGGLFYITKPSNVRAILRSGVIQPSNVVLPANHGASSARGCLRIAAISLFDAQLDKTREHQWLTIHQPVTVAIKLRRRALRGRMIAAAEFSQKSASPTLPCEIDYSEDIPLRAVHGFAFVSSADRAIHRLVPMTRFSKIDAVEIILDEFERGVDQRQSSDTF